MLLGISIVLCAVLSIVPHAARCDAGMEKGFVRKSKRYSDDVPADDIDSGESQSNSNVNVNVNSNVPLDWQQPQTYRANGLPNSQHGMGLRKTLNEFMPPIRLSPNSNIDFNFAHPEGNMRLSRKKPSRSRISKWRPQPSEDLEPSEDFTVCYPVVLRTVEYLKRIETNLIDLEEQLRAFLLR